VGDSARFWAENQGILVAWGPALPHEFCYAGKITMAVVDLIYNSIKEVWGIADAEFFMAVRLPPPLQNQDWRIVNLHDHMAYLEAHIECLKDLIEKHR
jgi:hypothetical protein